MSASFPIEYPEAESIAERVRAVDGVADLYPGHFGEVALLFAGHRVAGLRVNRDDHLEVHVVADLNHARDLNNLSEAVRSAAAQDSRPVDVIIADATA